MAATEQPQLVIPPDDAVVVFRTVKSGVLGRLVRLGAAADAVLTAHEMPDAAAEALGQALTLAALFGSALPADGAIILQTRTSGPVSLLVGDFSAPGRVRGYARFDAAALLSMSGGKPTSVEILGDGHLAITIDQGLEADRYQGVAALDGAPLADAAAQYFENREALPTFIRVAVARHYSKDDGGSWRWRAGGLMIQSLAIDAAANDLDDEDKSGDGAGDHWNRVRTLAATVEDHELLDPELLAERLLLRLFHEEGVRVERAEPLRRYCRCSRERVADVLNSFGAKELADMRDDAGNIVVTCEFCASRYAFDPSEIMAP